MLMIIYQQLHYNAVHVNVQIIIIALPVKKHFNFDASSLQPWGVVSTVIWGSRLGQRIFPRFAPMSPGFDLRSRHLCALGFQSKLSSAGFYLGTPAFLLHLKLDQKDLKSDQRALLENSDTH